PAERQPRAGTEVYRETGLVPAPARPRCRPVAPCGAGCIGGRFQRDADRAGCLQAGTLAERRAVPTRGARGIREADGPGLDGLHSPPAPRRADLYFLGLLPECLAARCRAAAGPSADLARSAATLEGGRSGPACAGLGE